MKALRCTFAFAAVGLLFPGCSAVTTKKPAGDSVAKLDPAVWESVWRGPDNFRTVSTIKDPAKGLVELRSLDPKESKDRLILTIRNLDGRLVATASGKADATGMAFFRIAATPEHVSGFAPRLDLFKEAVASKKIEGEVRQSETKVGDKTKNSPVQTLVILDQFGSAEVNRMFPEGQRNVISCFDPDPDIILVREKAPVKPEAGKGKRAN